MHCKILNDRGSLQLHEATSSMANNDTVLAELEAQLRAPDSILEPNVLDLLKDYLRAGGKPQAAIEDLSENYCGVYCSSVRRGRLAAVISANLKSAVRNTTVCVILSGQQAANTVRQQGSSTSSSRK
eukprot:GHRQ01024038.1.p1 GENE.GHRQ01024038.1~~GHRQ01024038.1.p1  ORF type:complete len:127 (+),score=32.03 GHRQ01024038.1:531-911(+)